MIIKCLKENYIACLLGGAIGDALGAPIEFLSIQEIKGLYSPSGVTDYIEFADGTGEFTDDTQMTLFTAEGLLRARHRDMLKGIGGSLNTITHHS
ncbi:MAG: ADP-ribosylglycohydrolase family protein [Mariniphaga sp.]|nr:ADP-ribosylglycohydrolase family protein [Mariniphaga sp.]